MPTLDDEHPGVRIQRERKLAHLSQRQLAARIPYSYSLLNQVECGARDASDGLLAAVASALSIDIDVLTETPHATDLQQRHVAALVRPIRRALDLFDLDRKTGMPGKPLGDLIAEADRVCQLVRATHLRQAAQALPVLIVDLTRTVHTAPTTEAWQALASAYRTAHDVSLKVGYTDLAIVALDRMGWAAERASDPCLAAVRQYKRALGHKDGEQDLARRLVAVGHELLAGQSSREALAVTGQLHLGASAVAARAHDARAVDAHITEARNLADRVGGEAGDVHWLSFGHINVALHEMGASLQMKQFDRALTQARAVKLPASTLASRRSRYLVDRAVVEMEAGYTDGALRHLVQARKAAPEQTRYHPGAREAISGLLHISRRTPDTLSHMAAWVGL